MLLTHSRNACCVKRTVRTKWKFYLHVVPNCMTSFFFFVIQKCCVQKTGVRNSLKYFRRFRICLYCFIFLFLLLFLIIGHLLYKIMFCKNILFQSKLNFHVQYSANSQFKQKTFLKPTPFFFFSVGCFLCLTMLCTLHEKHLDTSCMKNISTPLFTFQGRDKVRIDT